MPSFLGHAGDERDHEFMRKVASERRKLSADDQMIARRQTLQRIRGETVSEADPQRDLKHVYNEWVLDVQSRFEDRIIRRDLQSTRWDGVTINQSLPPKQVIVATCKLNEKEMEVLDDEIAEIKNT